ncbi:MAG: diadenylate cyclase CdaA [Acutalibacteraceae bacterium]|nr:diadenylate cyclase CdaA [Acutalibacteraceae bacterium]
MWEAVTSIYKAFVSLMMTFKATDVLDIMIVAFIIYNLIKIVRETRAEQLVKGILVLIVAFFISGLFSLKMLNALFSSFFQFSVLAVLIVFQPELRSALEHIGRSKIAKYWNSLSGGKTMEEEKIKQIKQGIHCVSEAANNFQRSKTGALIVFERQTRLGDIINTGTVIDAQPSVSMIGNIFFNKAPLHDGAMIVRDGKIYAAGCILPLTKNNSYVSAELGTRHRAAIGISENSDAVIVVVSEETGNISMAVNGVLTRDYTRETLSVALENMIVPPSPEKTERTPIHTTAKKGKRNEKNKK